MTFLKVSGLTMSDDVELAVALGAWALGFVVLGEAQRPGAASPPPSWSGPHGGAHGVALLRPEQAAELVAVARARDADVLTVARVAGDDAPTIAAAARAAGVAAVEIGSEADAAAVRAAMRAAGLAGAALIAARDAAAAEEADYVVFPHVGAGERGRGLSDEGGSGDPRARAKVWDPVTRPAVKRVIVAGHIDAAGVGAVVRRVHPFAIDVTGGARASFGALDEAGLQALVVALMAADAEGLGTVGD